MANKEFKFKVKILYLEKKSIRNRNRFFYKAINLYFYSDVSQKNECKTITEFSAGYSVALKNLEAGKEYMVTNVAQPPNKQGKVFWTWRDIVPINNDTKE